MKKVVVRFTIPAAVVGAVVFSSVGSTGASAAALDLAAGQPARWVTESYSVLAATPVDGDGRPHPVPPPKAAPHPNPSRVAIHPLPPRQWPRPEPQPNGKLSDCYMQAGGPTEKDSVCNGPGTTGGAGQQRIIVTCTYLDQKYDPGFNQNSPRWTMSGPWVGPGKQSYVNCTEGRPKGRPDSIDDHPTAGHIEFR